jgi:hypothetical protein
MIDGRLLQAVDGIDQGHQAGRDKRRSRGASLGKTFDQVLRTGGGIG